jgi:CRISPR-associated protein Csd1
MILKALCDYYRRCKDLAPAGMEYKEIGFIIVIDKEGNFVRLEDRRIDKKTCQRFLVAKSVGRTSAPLPNLMWDNSSYLFCFSGADVREEVLKAKPESELTAKEKEDLLVKIPKEKAKNIKCYQCFVKEVNQIYSALPDNPMAKSVSLFYQHSIEEIQQAVISDPLWESIKKDLTKNFSFLLQGETSLVAEEKEILAKFNSQNSETDGGNRHLSRCLITGDDDEIVETTTATSIPGSQATAKLVSFQVNSGYDSYGKSKGYNAPISKKADFEFSTALNRLTGKDSTNKFSIGSRTYVFWASSNSMVSQKAENCLFAMFGPKMEDDPNQYTDEVKNVFMDIYSGVLPSESDDRFFILGLAPNSARIAVVYWCEQPVKDFAKHILKHFEDMEIEDTRPEQKPYRGLHAMMANITLGGKASDVQPNLPDAVIRSIMQGLPYPETLFASCIRRIRADQGIYITRVAIIKGYLNRLNNHQQKIKVMLDKENTNQGYLCGRLFATLEYIQERANKIHSIRERYINAASATPAAVFATLLNLSVHHAEKLDRGGQVFLEKLKSKIMEKISPEGFPTHLDLNDQGRFFVGYYHQRQDLYRERTTEDGTEE